MKIGNGADCPQPRILQHVLRFDETRQFRRKVRLHVRQQPFAAPKNSSSNAAESPATALEIRVDSFSVQDIVTRHGNNIRNYMLHE